MDPIETKYIQDFSTYIKSLDFRDPFIYSLCLLHLGLLLTILLTRQHTNFQIFLFLVLLSTVYFSEYINETLARRWELIMRQNYLDSSGMFLSICFSMPILINCILIIGLWLYDSMQTMVKVKKAQLLRASKTVEVKLKES